MENTNVTKTFEDFLKAYKSDREMIYGKINQHKEEMRELQAKIHANVKDLSEMAYLFRGIADRANAFATETAESTARIDDMFEYFSNDLPAGDAQTFVGYCDKCGGELHEGDDIVDNVDVGEIYCRDCANEICKESEPVTEPESDEKPEPQPASLASAIRNWFIKK